MLIVFGYGADYFHTLTSAVSITKIMAIRDLIFISSLPQYLILVLLVIRALGVDLKKFGFQDDKEYLDLEEKDNEEFEFEVNVDKDKYRRELKKQWRYFNYFYQENKRVLQIIVMGVFVGLIGFSTYYFNVTNKVYKQGEKFSANQYTIQVNEAYVTDKDFSGNLILGENSNKKFVILDITVTNNTSSRTMNMDRFHLLNGLTSVTNTLKYNKSFIDLGKPYVKKELTRGETRNFLLIYQVDSKLENDGFVFAYQGIVNSQKLKAKKVKLKPLDLSKPTLEQEKKSGEDLTIIFPNRKKKNVQFLDLNYLVATNYHYERCTSSDCYITTGDLKAKEGKILMVLSFVSEDFDTSELVDFSSKYGTINYVNNNKETKGVAVAIALNRIYQGNYLYFSVPEEVKDSNKVSLNFTVRDKKYVYNLR